MEKARYKFLIIIINYLLYTVAHACHSFKFLQISLEQIILTILTAKQVHSHTYFTSICFGKYSDILRCKRGSKPVDNNGTFVTVSSQMLSGRSRTK